VEWNYQRNDAEKAVRNLVGVVGVSNGITLKAAITPANVTGRIRNALTRHAEREAKNIEVIIKGSAITLLGEADSLADRAAIFGAACSSPGVSSIVNEITIRP